MTEQKIGLSLSMCVGDVIAGQISEDEIQGIVAGTAAESPADVDRLMANYAQYYWQDNPELGEELARKMLAEGKVYQPRLEGKPAPRPVPLRWLKAVEDWQGSYPTSSI